MKVLSVENFSEQFKRPKQTTMKSNNVLTPLLAFVCLLLWAALELQPETRDYQQSKQQQRELKVHQDSITVLNQKNEQLALQLLQLRNQKDSLLNQITIHKQNIQQLKINQHEKVSRISQLHAHGLYLFFAGFNANR